MIAALEGVDTEVDDEVEREKIRRRYAAEELMLRTVLEWLEVRPEGVA